MVSGSPWGLGIRILLRKELVIYHGQIEGRLGFSWDLLGFNGISWDLMGFNGDIKPI